MDFSFFFLYLRFRFLGHHKFPRHRQNHVFDNKYLIISYEKYWIVTISLFYHFQHNPLISPNLGFPRFILFSFLTISFYMWEAEESVFCALPFRTGVKTGEKKSLLIYGALIIKRRREKKSLEEEEDGAAFMETRSEPPFPACFTTQMFAGERGK